nr:hypothetical protein [Tanacetum cinerariifolium]
MDSSLEIVYPLRRYELMRASTPSPHDVRVFHPLTRTESTSTKALTIAHSPQDEDAKRTLINMLNLLRWYEFDLMMNASTSTSAPTITASTSLERDNKWRLQTEVMKLFNQALKDAFPEFTEKYMVLCLPRDDHFQ